MHYFIWFYGSSFIGVHKKQIQATRRQNLNTFYKSYTELMVIEENGFKIHHSVRYVKNVFMFTLLLINGGHL